MLVVPFSAGQYCSDMGITAVPAGATALPVAVPPPVPPPVAPLATQSVDHASLQGVPVYTLDHAPGAGASVGAGAEVAESAAALDASSLGTAGASLAGTVSIAMANCVSTFGVAYTKSACVTTCDQLSIRRIQH